MTDTETVTVDPSVEKEVRVFGPPGTGKTTWLAGAVRATARERGTSRLVVASFTVAAAREIGGRGLPIDKSQVGTLHALAYRAINRPPVAEEKLADWNQRYPALRMSNGFRNDDGVAEPTGACEGDALVQQTDTLRARMVDPRIWPSRARQFHDIWTEWKREEEVIDFTDMIEMALDTEEAPGRPVVGFFDEFQDFTPLEIKLVRHWGRSMDRVVIAGDDDQSLYSFKGASPDAFLDPPVPDDQKRLLSQSHRVPHAVHQVAQHWVEQLSRREPKDYEPRDVEGLVRHSSLRYKYPDDLVRDVERQVSEGRSCMVLGTCGYMLDPIKHRLRERGVPYHNPYRARGDWNPLRPTRGISGADRLVAYLIMDERLFGDLSRLWTGVDVKKWSAVIKKSGVFRRGAGAAINALPDRELTYEEVARLFEDEADIEAALEPSLDWLRKHLLASARPTMDYPIEVARRRGAVELVKEPLTLLGTIHSVKGGEADVVYLMPDLSLAGVRQWERRGDSRDAVIRQMYVGMTRAREELVICDPSSQVSIDPAEMMRGAR